MNIVKRVQIENNVGEREYRQLEALNASGIKLFLENRAKFYNEYILLQPRKQESTYATLIGSMCHAILAENGEYETTYTLSTVPVPVGQMLELCDTLYEISRASMVEQDGMWIQQREFSELLHDAINKTKYDYTGKEVKFLKKDSSKIVEMFTETDKKTGACGERYYQELLKNTGKVVVSIVDMQKAEDICNKLKSHPYTEYIFNRRTEEGVREILTEYVIQWQIGNIKCKGKLDRIEIDHIQKEITPYDHKTSWDISEGGYAYGFLKKSYYIPAAFYDYGVKAWALENGMGEYRVVPMKHIACDVSNKIDPIIYELSEEDLNKAWSGFSINGKEYIGITEAINNIAWHMETGIWGSTMEAYKKNGVLPLNIKYDKK